MSAFPDFWNDQDRSTKILREKSGLEKTVSDMNALTDALEEAEVLFEMGTEGDDPETLQESIDREPRFKQEIKKVLSLMLSVVEAFPSHQFVIAGAPSQSEAFYKSLIK